ncbi:trp operon leader peptide [Streptomyces sp. NPDC050560]
MIDVPVHNWWWTAHPAAH